MKVILAAHSFDPRSGGPAVSIPSLAKALSARGIQVQLLSRNATDASLGLDISNGCGYQTTSNKAALKHFLASSLPDLIHDNGIWLKANHDLSILAGIKNIPRIVSIRGMLEKWALSHHGFRKRMAMALYQRHDLDSARLLVATSESEYQSIRAQGFRMPVALIPNGVDFPDNQLAGTELQPINIKKQRRALFVSRIHPKKGLLNLLDAWKQAGLDGWILEIAGPDESSHLHEVRSRISVLGISDSVKYIGELAGNQKAAAYSAADLFILPTFSENFGMVIAESLSFGVPVITTKGTPWADLEKYDCGWWIDIGVEPLVAALKHAASLTDVQRSKMGSNGRDYVRRYNWQDIATQMTQTYNWILGRAEKPDCVRLD